MTDEDKKQIEELKALLAYEKECINAYKSLMAYWKRRCEESDEFIGQILELLNREIPLGK